MTNIKTTIRQLIIFVLLILITVYVVFRNQNPKELFTIISNSNYLYLIIAFLCMLMFFVIQAHNVKSLLKSLGEPISFLKMLKFTIIEFFFSAITPASTGGQPVEIYYMSKEKISTSKSTLVLLVQVCSYQIAILLFTIIGALIKPEIITGVVKYFFIYGVIINIIVIFSMGICIFSTRTATRIITFFLKVAKKLHLNKIVSKEESIINGLSKYHDGSKYIKKHKIEFFKSMFRAFFQLAFHFVITYFVYRALGLSEYNIIEISAIQVIFYACSGCIPLPGSIGASEMLYLVIYKDIFGEGLLRPAMLLNLSISFYVYVIISLCVVIYTTIFQKSKKEIINERN